MSLDMNPEIRARWAAALRSGEYAQGRSALREGDKFCCLGVLCDLAVKAGVLEARQMEDTPLWYYDGHPDYLPELVREWAGLSHDNPLVAREYAGEGISARLADLNDDESWDFAQIADAIDGGDLP